MESKYYTPSIEEFHVGFEFEWKDLLENDGWESERISMFDGPMISHGSGFCPFEYALDQKSIRVKYLDVEDIQSLGWKFIGKSIDIWFELEGTFDMFTWTAYRAIMHYGLHDRRMFIHVIDCADEYDLYKGEVKNKSELEKLMKQLRLK
jgi:hypothetical protein